MKLSDIVSSLLSVIAIVVSLLVWHTTDTRATELRDKRLNYHVDWSTERLMLDESNEGEFSDVVDGVPVAAQASTEKSVTLNQTEIVEVVVTNEGSLPTKDVEITVTTKDSEGKLPAYTIELIPSVDREIVPQDKTLVIRLKNPLGPHEQLKARVAFEVMKNKQMLAHDFTLKEAFVVSEVGAASLVASPTTLSEQKHKKQ